MQHGRLRPFLRAAALAGAAVASTTACSGSEGTDPAAVTSSQAAALSSAAQASPGDYGSPVDPSLPNPTAVATDAPVSTSPAGSASVIITYAGWIDTSSAVEVGALVPGVVEDGGTCTLTLTGAGDPITVSSDAEADVDSTSCPTMTVPGSDLASGTYAAVVAYRSSSGTGSSAPTAVVVP